MAPGTPRYDAATLEFCHNELIKRRAELVERLQGNCGPALVEERCLSNSEKGNIATNDERSKAIQAKIKERIADIDEALAKIKADTFGLCVGKEKNCHGLIPLARLKATDYMASRCVNCQEEYNKTKLNNNHYNNHFARLKDTPPALVHR